MQCNVSLKSQRGATLLVMLSIVILGTLAWFITDLNANFQRSERLGETQAALKEAKAALIGYAVDDANRPGELPYPDCDNDGDYTGGVDNSYSCRVDLGSDGLIGWLPWKHLHLPDLRDGSSSRLWYAVSDSFLAKGGIKSVLNSDSVGQLQVDGISEIIAIVIAPGESIGNQNRILDEAQKEIDDYLELDNSDLDNIFETFTTTNNEFNDRILTITYHDLMPLVERRVLSEVEEILKENKTNFDNKYPWLSPFQNPDNLSEWIMEEGQRQGQLPFHYELDKPFKTPFTVNWAGLIGINPSTHYVVQVGTSTVFQGIENLYNSNGLTFDTTDESYCTWTLESIVPSVKASAPELVAKCTGKKTLSPPSGVTKREVTIHVHIMGNSPDINNLPSVPIRTRNVTENIFGGEGKITWELVDYDGNNDLIGKGLIQLDSAVLGSINVSDIHYNLVISDGRGWYVENEWYKYIYIAYCEGAISCLELQYRSEQVDKDINDGKISSPPNEPVNGLIIHASRPLLTPSPYAPPNSPPPHKIHEITYLPQDRTSLIDSPELKDYLDNFNNDSIDSEYELRPPNYSFNDQIRILR